MNGAGYTVHIGTEDRYVALYSTSKSTPTQEDNYHTIGALNHIGVVVPDIKAAQARVTAAGFTPNKHGDYEPGLRFYFYDDDNIEYEVVSYS